METDNKPKMSQINVEEFRRMDRKDQIELMKNGIGEILSEVHRVAGMAMDNGIMADNPFDQIRFSLDAFERKVAPELAERKARQNAERKPERAFGLNVVH